MALLGEVAKNNVLWLFLNALCLYVKLDFIVSSLFIFITTIF